MIIGVIWLIFLFYIFIDSVFSLVKLILKFKEYENIIEYIILFIFILIDVILLCITSYWFFYYITHWDYYMVDIHNFLNFIGKP